MNRGVIILFFISILIVTSACSQVNNDIQNITNITDTIETTDTTMATKNKINLTIGDTVLIATMADNSSVDALIEALSEAPITIDMRDYANMEKVGTFGQNFPTNDESITTQAGDLILYQGNAFVIYYAPNSWTFTRLGKIDNITQDNLKDVLGKGDVTVTLSLSKK